MRHFQKHLMWMLLSALMLPLASASCKSSSGDDAPVAENLNVQFQLPAKIDITAGGEYTFDVINGLAPLTSDYLVMEGSNGVSQLCSIINTSERNFTVRFNKNVTDGNYNVYLKRGDRKKSIGQMAVTIVTAIIEPAEGATIYGLVNSNKGPVKGVVVSDGVEVTTTDANGVYNLKSNKKYGYVFISLPSGYEAETDGVLPVIYRNVSGGSKAERADFYLTTVANPDNYKVIFLGDMHLANRTNDLNQFADVMRDLNSYRSAHSSEKIYGITLGDMTWDLYWYANKFQFADYLKTINQHVKGMTIFHTMGNHDNDMKAFNDFDAEKQYRANIAPCFYSFNIGKIHYVVLDDIDCSTYDGTDSRNYVKSVSTDQLSWLAKDLAYVDKGSSVILTAHAQFFRPDEASGFKFKVDHAESNTNAILDLLSGYKLQIVTGHTHNNFNIIQSESVINGRDVAEHNVAAICASWWWSGNLTPGHHVCLDGSPGGYAIWDINGTDMKWRYKGSGRSEDYQFRTYDLNKVSFSTADAPNMTTNTAVRNDFKRYTDAYPVSNKNEVLINVWNYNPRWTITVTTETGVSLTPVRVWAYDPLHIAALTVKRFNSSSLTSSPAFITEKAAHFFKVTCPDANVDLNITVKDEFGNTSTEKMARPKVFTTDAYK